MKNAGISQQEAARLIEQQKSSINTILPSNSSISNQADSVKSQIAINQKQNASNNSASSTIFESSQDTSFFVNAKNQEKSQRNLQ